MSGNVNQSEGSFTAAETTDIRRFCGYPAYGAFGYVWSPGYAYLDTQIAAMAPAEIAVIRTTYLPALYLMETAIDGASANIDTDQASVWIHNKNEVADRTALFNQKRRGLCNFIGCPLGPALTAGGTTVIRG
jgi:hypothetical protein